MINKRNTGWVNAYADVDMFVFLVTTVATSVAVFFIRGDLRRIPHPFRKLHGKEIPKSPYAAD